LVPGQAEGRHHLSQNVRLTLVDRAVADPDGTRVGISGKVTQLAFGQLTGPVDGIHALHVFRVAGDGAQEPVAPEHRLIVIARSQQRLEGQRCVA
jgi:hypothetical protein